MLTHFPPTGFPFDWESLALMWNASFRYRTSKVEPFGKVYVR